MALELAARGAVASAVGLAPIGFWSARERAFCQASVRGTRTLARRLRPLAPALLRLAPLRALLFAQFAAHPAAHLAGGGARGHRRAHRRRRPSTTSAPRSAATSRRRTRPTGVPVTIAWGSRDRLLLPRQLERARRRLPRARHVLITGAGHLMMRDDPHAVADVVRSGARAPA